MLIVCSGPDTWRARKRAQELVEAFKAKHDASGFSTEALKSGDFQAVMNQIGAPSIFSPKRFIRCDGLLEGLKIADIRKLSSRLKTDGENTILLTVEAEPPAQKTIDEFEGQGFFHYAYPNVTGSAFQQACIAYAKDKGVSESKARTVASRCDGDMWMAVNELSKLGAYADAPLSESEYDQDSLFALVDDYLIKNKSWRDNFWKSGDDQVPSLLLTQTKTALRIKDGEPVKLPIFVIRKFKNSDPTKLENSFFKSLLCFISLRSGLSGTKELESIL
ncbi:hypothetical protein HZC53_01480 [Candidatus Uhrbacteria bacterium]|nr:hypothetical protein [Candidatus Uhrbacteria bacterium]